MATKISLQEAEELSMNYFEKGFVAFPEDLHELYLAYSEIPLGPSKIFYYHEHYLVHMIEKKDNDAEVTRYEQHTEPMAVQEFILNAEKVAAGTYGLTSKAYDRHACHEYVDLGLPSGLKWAISAHFMSFAWGEVLPQKYSQAKKNVEKRTRATVIKADPSMDAARYNWGGKWRMPGMADFQELMDQCSWRWRKYGFIVTGPNGNSIFFNSRHLWTCESPEGEDKAIAFIVGRDERKFSTVHTGNGFYVWPVFSENDVESPKIDRINIVKKGTVKIGADRRMSYTISADEVLTVRGDLSSGRDEYSIFPIHKDIGYWYNHLVVADGAENIGNYLFYRAYFDTVKLPKSLRHIGALAFADNSSLTSIQLNEGLQSIGVRAFDNCSKLKEIVIPEGVEEIKTQAFYGCKGLERVVFPSTLRCIGDDAFQGCNRIRDLVLPEGLELIGDNAFHNNDSIESLVIPPKVRSIGRYAFYGFKALASVTLYDGLEEIREGAFKNTSISEIRIPATVKRLHPDSFDKNTKVIEAPKSLYYILVDPLYKNGCTQVFGKAYYSALAPSAEEIRIEARKVMASNLHGSAQYLDWKEDCEWGVCQPFYEYIDCSGDNYAVLKAENVSAKEGLDENGFIDETLFKQLSAKVSQWNEIRD